jgi:MinD superfamily P-loop ATPase
MKSFVEDPKELVVLSGKGGTGKTSITAAFAALANRAVIADCDVDAADLHLVLEPKTVEEDVFLSGQEALIDPQKCTGCGVCLGYCNFGALRVAKDRQKDRNLYTVDPLECSGCGLCARFCPKGAISLRKRAAGRWSVSRTACGTFVHARLEIGGENSGKLVSLVRKKAQESAKKEGVQLILIDGPPGIGCPVIASLTGASHVLLVTEPTLSGLHDLERVLELAGHFRIPASIVINKHDLNPIMTKRIEETGRRSGAAVLGRIDYDDSVTKAQIEAKPVVDLAGSTAALQIRHLWQAMKDRMGI